MHFPPHSPWVAEPEPVQPAQSKTGKYVPPSLRDGGTRRGESMQPNRRGAFKSLQLFMVCPATLIFMYAFAPQQLMTTQLFAWPICLRTPVRRTCKNYLDHLVPSQGSTWPRTRTLGSQRSVLVVTLAWGSCLIVFAKMSSYFSWQGFAFISFHRREDASRAIAGVSGFGYDHLILNVEWAK